MDESQKHFLSERKLEQNTTYCVITITWSLKQIKLIYSFKRALQLLSLGDDDGDWLATKGHEFTFSGETNVLYLNKIWGYTGICISQNSINHILLMCAFYSM